MTVDVLMPTLGMNGDETEKSLRDHLPMDYRLLKDDTPGWACSMNVLLERRDPSRDAIIIDDDVTIQEETFRGKLALYFPSADIFGFLLLFPNGRISHAGAHMDEDNMPFHVWRGKLPGGEAARPAYVPHVTTSLAYVKAEVLATGWRFPEWSGAQFEDCAFSYSMWAAGKQIMYVPQQALHMETLTKSRTGAIAQSNLDSFRDYCIEEDLLALMKNRFPDGERGIL